MFTEQQQQILQQENLALTALTETQLFQQLKNPGLVIRLSDAELEELLQIANILYRGGVPIVSDADYDFVYMHELERRNPRHPLLSRVEPEPAFYGKTLELPEKMLSTDKAYTQEEIERWLKRIEKAAQELGKDTDSLSFKITPKLDGYAAYDDGTRLYTRGDGKKGTDISRVFERGLQVANAGIRGLGAGEVVISKTYFKQHLADKFDNSRNFQASIIKEKDLSAEAEQAILNKAAVFYPFALLPAKIISGQELLADFDNVVKSIWHQTDYDVDGVVLEVTDDEIKTYMGATRHHHRWQIAYKENLSSATVKVLGVTAQTSRSGRITPVAELEPVRLSGALISRATAHHYKMVLDKGIGTSAIIRLARSGEVIPKIEEVLQAVSAEIPKACSSCGAELIWDGDFLLCTNNINCPAQITHTMEHFFKTLANNDGFGNATIARLYECNVRNIAEIYLLTEQDFIRFGFGNKQAQNLVAQLLRSRSESIEDWRFLAAFGVFRMGLGNCEKLLSRYPLTAIFTLTEADIIAVEGFAEKTATVVTKGFARIQTLFNQIYSLGFNLQSSYERTQRNNHPLAGKLIVFSGTMQHGSREEMEKQAKSLGAKIGSSVSAKTDFLVIGEKVGASKIKAAQEKNVVIISEQQYLQILETQAH